MGWKIALAFFAPSASRAINVVGSYLVPSFYAIDVTPGSIKVREGQPVTVTLDALPQVELNGQILSIGQNYSENQGDVVYEVTILLTDTHPAMRWGMTAAVKFGSED